MAAWLASRAVLLAPVAVRRVRVLTALESLTLDIRMAVSAETIDGLAAPSTAAMMAAAPPGCDGGLGWHWKAAGN